MTKPDDLSQDPIEQAWEFVEEFDEYCQEMTTGRLDGPPAKELANIFEKAIMAARLQEREECAKVADEYADFEHNWSGEVASAIRARK